MTLLDVWIVSCVAEVGLLEMVPLKMTGEVPQIVRLRFKADDSVFAKLLRVRGMPFSKVAIILQLLPLIPDTVPVWVMADVPPKTGHTPALMVKGAPVVRLPP